MNTLAAERGDASICKYARDFDYRNLDTKILREVWNEIQDHLGKFEGKEFPVETTDELETTYEMDPDDLDDICFLIADRLGIEIKNTEDNPYFNRVATVKDLVLFLQNQPRVKNA